MWERYKMKKVYDLSLSFSSFERGLWFDHDKREYQPEGWGIRLAVLIGEFARPIALGSNPWKEKPWFVIRLPFLVLPFLAVAIGKYGFYIGGKAFDVDAGEPWANPEEVGKELLTVSTTIRKSRWI